jgi:serine/threonine-protein kinase
MGKVFRAEDTTLHRLVALKALPRVFRTRNYTINAEELIREARSAAAIEHPHVVQIHEAGEANGVFYIAMELVEGGTIYDLVRGAGPLDPQRACQITAEAAEALAYAHQLGIVHRDIKPSNLMLTRAGRCKVVDFGLARVEDATGTFVPLGETVGTAYFVAPEVIAGGQATPKSDIYSLAATLYLLLAGRVPYEGDSKAKVLKQHMSAPPPDLAQVRPDLPESLVKLVARGMAKRPEDRFESAGQFAKALRVHTIPVMSASGSFTPQPPGSGELSAAPQATTGATVNRRIPYLIGAAVLAVGIIAAVIIAVVLAHSGPKNETASAAGTNNVMATPVTAPPVAHPGDNTAKAAELPKAQPAAPPENPAPQAETPKPPPAAPEVSQPAAPTLPAGVIDANDAGTLMRIAKGEDSKHPDRRVVVEGTPQSAEVSSSGKVFRIEFAGANGDEGLLAAYFPANNVFAKMAKKFGGANGEGLAGKRLRIKGQVEVYNKRPEIVIFGPDQVEVVE